VDRASDVPRCNIDDDSGAHNAVKDIDGSPDQSLSSSSGTEEQDDELGSDIDSD